MAEEFNNEKAQKERNNANNAKAAKAGLKVAGDAGFAPAKVADKVDDLTGGTVSKLGGKALTNANKVMPGGKVLQNMSNLAGESGLTNLASHKNGLNNLGGGPSGSLPSSGSNIVGDMPDVSRNIPPQVPSGENTLSSGESEEDNSKKSSGGRKIAGVNSSPRHSVLDDDSKEKNSNSVLSGTYISPAAKVIIMSALPSVFFVIVIIVVIVSLVGGIFSDYEDAFGIANASGGETGGVEFSGGTKEQREFYERVNDVKLSYQANGKSVDSLKIVALFHVLNVNNAGISYEDMDKWTISSFADAMFDGNVYSDETFKQNIINVIAPKYLKGKVSGETIAEQVFDYIERYNSWVNPRVNGSSSCGTTGNCSYDIKGFYIPGGAGNISKNIKISNLKVRPMECGSPYGNGSYTKAIDEDLVDFEDYIAGVAYAEVGTSFPEQAIKAQMIAARSFALSRPTAMNNSLGKKLEEENGQWILQISSCVADQVFCNIDKGCSHMGGGDGQGGISRSGIIPGAQRTVQALPSESPLRQYAKETQGEVLVNAQGNIIAAGFLSSDQYEFKRLADQGLNYKQILLQVYNKGNRNYGASDIVKASCGSSTASCGVSTGEYASWKQYEGPWANTVTLGTSGKTIRQIGCLATSVAILIAKSGVPTNIPTFNPGTFVEYLNSHNGFSGGNFMWAGASAAAPSFKFQNSISVSGMSQQQKLSTLQNLLNNPKAYVVAEVKGNTGQHWVAIDSINGSTINMMDPGSSSTDMWAQYPWSNTSTFVVFAVD